MTLAKEHGVTIRSLNTGAAAPGTDVPDIGVTSIDISMNGQYEAVARLIETVHDLGGYIRTSSLTVTPIEAEGEQLVFAQYVGEALSFAVPPVLLSLEKNDHDQR